MAHEWNVSYPLDQTLISGVPGAIRALKVSVKTQIDHEHETPVDGDATGGEHSSGSAVTYEGTSTPTNRPGGTALADNAVDRGRIWLDDTNKLKRWDGTAFVGAGGIVQIVNTQTGAVDTGTTLIPNDDTIPQITEGDEYMTLAITPTHASNKLLIEIVCNVASSATGDAELITLALFQDTTANALAAMTKHMSYTNEPQPIVLKHYMAAGTTSETTFRVRIGNEVGGTLTLNGLVGARKLGGVMVSSITITEIAMAGA